MIRALWTFLFLVAAVLLMLATAPAHAESMVASYYGAESGKRTASGAAFHPGGLTCALPNAGRRGGVPFGTRLRVCLRGCVVVTVTDVGPARWTRRGIDLSRGAAVAIGLVGRGVGRVSVERVGAL